MTDEEFAAAIADLYAQLHTPMQLIAQGVLDLVDKAYDVQKRRLIKDLVREYRHGQMSQRAREYPNGPLAGYHAGLIAALGVVGMNPEELAEFALEEAEEEE